MLPAPECCGCRAGPGEDARGHRSVSHGPVPTVSSSSLDIEAHLGHYIGTIGFFVPAALLIALVVTAVVRDRRRHGREDEETATTPPRAD